MDEQEKQKVKFKYKVSNNYGLYAIAGAQGGISAQGNIVVNFFSERMPIPKMETFEVSPLGQLSPTPVDREIVDAIIRDIMFGISINPEIARSIAKWLNQKADECDKAAKLFREKIEGQKNELPSVSEPNRG